MDSPSQHEVLQVDGMTCANCALGIKNVLKNKGLSDVEVSFASGEVHYTPIEAYPIEAIHKDIQSLGYRIVAADAPEKTGLSQLEKRFLFSLVFTLPLLAHMFISWAPLHSPVVQFFLSLPVMISGLNYFGKSAFHSLKSGVPNMDVLITVGSTAAFIYSCWGSWIHFGTPEAHNYLFFETAATIITLVLLGNVIEQRSVKQTGSAIRSLGKMQPATALRIEDHEGHEHLLEIPAHTIAPGDVLEVHEGDSIPADGIIMSGSAVVNESMLSGESLPVEKGIDALVSGGTLCEQGNFRMRAMRSGGDTVLSKIIELVKKAQNGKPSIQRIGDKVSAVFVPVVLGIALITWIVNQFIFDISVQDSIMRAIAVLVISCPCAMGLATPTAIMAGLGRAAKMGLLFRDGSVTEELAKVDVVVFDKTGTLTTGEFDLSKMENRSTLSEDEIASIVYSLSAKSSHPVAKSMARIYKGKKATISKITEQKGLGMEGLNELGQRMRLGSARLLNSSDQAKDFDLFLMQDETCLAAFQLNDRLKDGATEAIAELHQLKIKTVMLSGDTDRKCREIAQRIGIDQVFSQHQPEEKLERIRELMATHKVAMVGDGVNDAPAINLAHVGISLSNASEVARNSAQVIVLGKSDLRSISNAVKLSKLTLRTIHQNLFWAFFYNVIAIPIAAAGFLNPMVAAFSMAFSDVVVIGNSILLQFRKLKHH